MNRLFCIALTLFISTAHAHEFTPTYPKFELSMIEGVVQTKMKLFNKRRDVEYYELDVYDKDWKGMKFGSSEKLVQIGYLETKYIDVYLRSEDLKRAMYICTKSMLIAKRNDVPLISSRICSKIK